MKYVRRFFKPHKLILIEHGPPLIERRPWDEYDKKMRLVLNSDVLDDLGELTDEERKARQTRQLATPSDPTLHDINQTGRWQVYSAPTLKTYKLNHEQGEI